MTGVFLVRAMIHEAEASRFLEGFRGLLRWFRCTTSAANFFQDLLRSKVKHMEKSKDH